MVTLRLFAPGYLWDVELKQVAKLLNGSTRAIIGGLLMSGRRSNCDSGDPGLWSNGSVLEEPCEPISIDPSPHILLQQTTVSAPFLKGGKQKIADDADAVSADDPTPRVLLDG
jgi:hypothetical protein